MGNVLVVVPPFLRVPWRKNSTCYDREEGLGGKTKIPKTSGSFCSTVYYEELLWLIPKHSPKAKQRMSLFSYQGSEEAVTTISEGKLPSSELVHPVGVFVYVERGSEQKVACR